MQGGQILNQKSRALAAGLERNRSAIVLGWVLFATFACAVRLYASSIDDWPPVTQVTALLPYILVVSAPVATLFLASHWFPLNHSLPQPNLRLSCFGRWRNVSAEHVHASPYYGVAGILVSLLLGLLLNIPFRVLEFLGAVPVLGATPPAWFGSLYYWMLADAVLLSSLYAATFVAGLRRVPLFPRMLVLVWAVDISIQTLIAQSVGAMGDLPADVAISLTTLLTNNLYKVLISIGLWLPYLILSRRVNATFRQRLPG